MNYENPELQPPVLEKDESVHPGALDFVETPDVIPTAEGREPLPVWLYLICGFALFMAGSSFTGFDTFGLGLLDQGPGGPALVPTKGPETPAVTDPIALGKKVYNGNCASCHQANGEGQPGKYPPMANSEWVLGSKERLAAIIIHGLTGPVTVKGGSYGTDQMSAWAFDDKKMANVMTYIRKSWGNQASEVTPEEVAAARAKFASQSASYTEADLLKIAPPGSDPSDKKP